MLWPAHEHNSVLMHAPSCKSSHALEHHLCRLCKAAKLIRRDAYREALRLAENGTVKLQCSHSVHVHLLAYVTTTHPGSTDLPPRAIQCAYRLLICHKL